MPIYARNKVLRLDIKNFAIYARLLSPSLIYRTSSGTLDASKRSSAHYEGVPNPFSAHYLQTPMLVTALTLALATSVSRIS